jgi:hypothetical protein
VARIFSFTVDRLSEGMSMDPKRQRRCHVAYATDRHDRQGFSAMSSEMPHIAEEIHEKIEERLARDRGE